MSVFLVSLSILLFLNVILFSFSVNKPEKKGSSASPEKKKTLQAYPRIDSIGPESKSIISQKTVPLTPIRKKETTKKQEPVLAE